MSYDIAEDVNAGAEGTYALIGQTYDYGRKHQWAIELWRNPLQAMERVGQVRGDEQVVFDFVEFQWADTFDDLQRSARKRRVWNTGPPMDPRTELYEYFSKLAKGAGTNRRSRSNLAGQFGKGSRASVLPHSNMFVATTEPGGETHALCIVDTGRDTYGLVSFVFDATNTKGPVGKFDDDCYMVEPTNRWRLWLDTATLIHPEVIEKGGITTILCGMDMLEHYLNGDVLKNEGARGLPDDLTKWLNSPIPVTASFLSTDPKGTIIIDGQRHKMNPRLLKSYDDWIARVPASNQAKVSLDSVGTTLDVYLLPTEWNWDGPYTKFQKDRKLRDMQRLAKPRSKRPVVHEPNPGQFYIEVPYRDTWLPYEGKGFITFAYDYEMMPVGTKHKDWFINDPEVASRLGLIITPPKATSVGSSQWGVVQTGSRASITGPNEEPLPVHAWINTFYDLLMNHPDLDFLRKALDEARPRPPKQLDAERIKRIKEDVHGRLDAITKTKITVKTTQDTGQTGDERTQTVQVSPEHGKGRRKNQTKVNRKIVHPKPEGVANYMERDTERMPDYEYLTAVEWEAKYNSGLNGPDEDYSPKHFCVVELGHETTLYFNMGHEIYEGQRLYFTETWWAETNREAVRRRLNEVDIENGIQIVYAEEGISKVYYAHRMCRDTDGKVDSHEVKKLLHPWWFNNALGGWVDADAGIKKHIENLLRR